MFHNKSLDLHWPITPNFKCPLCSAPATLVNSYCQAYSATGECHV